ncbi:DUF6081 family protein [Verrucosispora sp. WMMA2044]|uniref:DUF6081 family protein n=1 Tax=Verrucosispora sp. WMMA2044 TaxID=3016419 RepID=UPI00248BB296|nr:DUF6081 family protein [Verrucosispora sp. WMMA2044]WBB50425.1 DUF6081 family protein [Verrucosispora sp. WMMA2044]
MSTTPAPTAWTYDDFTAPVIDSDRWELLRVPGPDGVLHTYQDRNARLHSGDGGFEMSIVPFSRFHDTSPIQNNAKQMYRSVQRFLVPTQGELRFEVNMAVRTYGQVPYDLLDAFGTVNVFDLETGVVFNVAATNDTIYAVVERLALPGIVRSDEHYVHRVVLDVPTEPGREHHYAITYRSDSSEAAWYVDGRRAYWARIPVPVAGFHAGMALFSARDLARYSRAEREHGQGATARWSGWTIDGCAPTVR